MINVEMLSTGDEVLHGQIIDTNAAWLADLFFEQGLPLTRRNTVGDNLESLVNVLRERSERCDVLIVNGGLGPTSDDLSALAAATAKGEGLVLHEAWLAQMERFFSGRGRVMAPSNRKQAEIPASAELIDNPVGTACGFAVQLNRCLMFFTPGVPSEFKVMVEQQIAQELQLKSVRTGTLAEIGQQADLAVVVGGDGNMLGAARTLARYDIKVIGVNRGNLGFLTDLDPDNAQQQLADVLEGHYISEKRFLLEAQVCQQDCQKRISTAINEVVLHPGKVAHMIEFEVYIDEIFAFSQRSDGLVISTPTGSTAYSLSAGGPILTPSLDAITLVPMFPHTLSARPLVINGDSTIRLRFSHRRSDLEISCDSQIALPIQEGEDVLIRRCDYHLNLIHPKDYSYFNTLSSKLGWSKKLF